MQARSYRVTMANRDSNEERLGRPIQIVREAAKRKVDEEALRSVLCQPNVRNKPISVISVIGACRTGKSFLLNYFLRYLENKGYENDSWIGDAETSLEGFSWSGGIDVNTKGIFIWSEPFVVSIDGTEIAVFLVDAQGSFDLVSSKNEFCSINIITLLMSSYTIYNVKHLVGQNDLELLQFCRRYLEKAMKKEDRSCQLQDFWFLIRDWENPYSYEYGSCGGQKYLKEKILVTQPQNNQESPDDLNGMKKQIEERFGSTKCFLMPSPGMKARVFSGPGQFRGCVRELEEDFKKHLRDFCECVLNPIFSTKGNMTGNTLLKFVLEVCDNITNHPDQFPRIESYFTTSIRVQCGKSATKWARKYKKSIKKKMNETYQEPEKFDEMKNKKLQKNRKKFFEEINVNEQWKDDCEKVFNDEITAANRKLKEYNSSLWVLQNEKVNDVLRHIWSKYVTKMEKHNEQLSSLEKVEFDRKHEKVLAKLEAKFYSEVQRIKLNKRKSDVEGAKNLLMKGIDSTYRTMILDLQYKKAKNLYEERQVICDSVKKYEDAIKSHVEEDAMELSLKYFNSHIANANWTFEAEELREILLFCFGLKFQEPTISKVVHEAYDNEVAQVINDKVTSERRLEEILIAIVSDIHEACELQVDGGMPEIETEEWKDEINQAKKKHQQLNKLREIRTYVKYFELAKPMLEQANKWMKEYEGKCAGEGLRKKIDENQPNYLEKCKEFTSDNYHSDDDVGVPNFSEQIDELFKICLDRDRVYTLLADVKLRLLTMEAEIEYLAKMKKGLSGKKVGRDEIQKLHEEVKEKVLGSLDKREPEITASRRQHIEDALNARVENMNNWYMQNATFFRRAVGAVAGGVGIGAGVGAGAGVALGVSAEIGLVTVGIATAATGVGAVLVAAATVAGIGYAIFRGTRKAKASDFIDKERSEVENRETFPKKH